jgi:hypothetical protein
MRSKSWSSGGSKVKKSVVSIDAEILGFWAFEFAMILMKIFGVSEIILPSRFSMRKMCFGSSLFCPGYCRVGNFETERVNPERSGYVRQIMALQDVFLSFNFT